VDKLGERMKKILVIILCFISFSLFSEELHYLPENYQNTDLRNKVWFWGTNSIGNVDEFLYKFGYFHNKETISENNLGSLTEPYRTICVNLLNRGRGIPIPATTYRFMLICDDKYGVMIFWWNDTSTFGGVDPQLRLMFRHFFELKIR